LGFTATLEEWEEALGYIKKITKEKGYQLCAPSVSAKMKINKEIVEKCVVALEDRFRTKNPSGQWSDSPIGWHLSDLTQNTVANIYYRYFMLEPSDRAEYSEKRIAEVAEMIEAKIKFGVTEFEAIIETNLASYKDRVVAEFAAINGLVEWLFKENWEQERWEQRGGPGFVSEVIRDIFKYRIRNVWDKTGLRRAIERKIAEKRVDEIPNLIDFMNSYWESDD
jgi:hypothetical protein